jgi:hypothetical protein
MGGKGEEVWGEEKGIGGESLASGGSGGVATWARGRT